MRNPRHADRPHSRSSQERFVALCQQLLVFGVLTVLAVSAANTVSLDMVTPDDQGSHSNQAIGDVPIADDSVAGAPDTADVESAPVEPTVTEVALSAATAEVDADQLVSAEQPLAKDSTVGITWAHGEALEESAIAFSLRTRTAGTWSGWEPIDYHDEALDQTAESRPGTEPVFTGDADAVQVKIEGQLPDDLKLAVVDPGDSHETRLEFPAIDTARLTAFESGDPKDPGSIDDPSDPGTPVPAGAIQNVAAVSSTPQPKIYSRAQWGAKESLRRVKTPSYGEIHGGFVHHTVSANNYTRTQVPKIIRGIYAFHTKSRKWNDIGYNFLVDKWGRIWEGRYGGVGRPVVGAHTSGYNSNSFAMAAIGNFQVRKPTNGMLQSFGKLFAWKLSQHGVSALSGKQKIGKKTFPAISGHRNAGKTSCPGKYLYAKLGTIRKLAAKYQAEMGSRQLSVNISGSGVPDLAVRDAATKRLSIVHVTAPFAFGTPAVVASGFANTDLLVAAGDLTGDGRADLLARDKTTKDTALVARSTSGFSAPASLGQVFADVDQLAAVGDVTGDGRVDVVGRDADSHDLLLFPGTTGNAFGSGSVLRSDWEYLRTTYAGDFDRDGKRELLASDSAGRIWTIPFTGATLGAPRALTGGLGDITSLVGVGDVTADGGSDLLVRIGGQEARIYQGGKGVGLGAPLPASWPFAGLTSLIGADVGGTTSPEVAGVDAAGNLVAFAGNGQHGVQINDTGLDLSGVNLLLNGGDWNRDGLGDLITRESTTGRIQLWLGRGDDTFNGPVFLSVENLNPLTQVIVPGDVTGDGSLDLVGRWGNGAFVVYPGSGTGQLKPSYQMHSSLPTDRLAAAGLFDADGAVDFFTTTSDGRLWLYQGNGPGGLSTGIGLAGSLAGTDWLIGLGDATGDGRPDLFGRTSDGGLSLYTLGSGGIAASRPLSGGMERFDLAG